MLQKWCFYKCYCLVLVARPCCSMYCNMQIYWRYTNHFQTHIQTFSWCPMHFAHCIIQNVLINVIHWSLLHLCVQGTCFDDVFTRSYALMAKHVAWLNIKIFCFKLLHHIEGDLFWSLGFSSMNLQYITELGCMSLKDVTKHLFVVQKNSHMFTMIFQQTCWPQINSLAVFTVVNKLLQPARSGVMEFMTWCLQQFSEAARVCFLCHCISTLKEKRFIRLEM